MYSLRFWRSVAPKDEVAPHTRGVRLFYVSVSMLLVLYLEAHLL